MRSECEELAVGRDKAGAFEGEEDASRGRGGKLLGAREVAQCHRAAGAAEFLQQAQTAIETLDEVGGTLVVIAALQLWHLALHGARAGPRLCLPSRRCMS